MLLVDGNVLIDVFKDREKIEPDSFNCGDSAGDGCG